MPTMNVSLPDRVRKLIEARLRSGQYATAEDVISAAVVHLDQHEQLAAPGAKELDALIAEGEADIERGDVLDLDEVFAELRRVSAHQRGSGK